MIVEVTVEIIQSLVEVTAELVDELVEVTAEIVNGVQAGGTVNIYLDNELNVSYASSDLDAEVIHFFI